MTQVILAGPSARRIFGRFLAPALHAAGRRRENAAEGTIRHCRRFPRSERP